MESVNLWTVTEDADSKERYLHWKAFLEKNMASLNSIQNIDLTGPIPVITDYDGRKFKIDFKNDIRSYHKKKGSIKTELISRALGAGRYGLKVLDLSAGLGIDSVFLTQLGYHVTGVERNPVIYLALEAAQAQLNLQAQSQLQFVFSSAVNFINSDRREFDVAYFDPMFPEKKKSALPKQEMVLFKNLVGSDDDAESVIEAVLQSKSIKRLAVKRPLKAPILCKKPQSQIEGKLIRFDVYGVQR